MDISKVWTFRSDSNPNKTYETLQYTDGTTSCNCPGWTRRVNNGQRTCKHIRMVDQGIADNQCISTHSYQTEAVRVWGNIKTTMAADLKTKSIKTKKVSNKLNDSILKPLPARKIHL